MDKKLEKYYRYIVDDLVSKTKIDHKNEIIMFPFFPLVVGFLYWHPDSISFFSKYIKEQYGVQEGEVDYIWNLYRRTIKELI